MFAVEMKDVAANKQLHSLLQVKQEKRGSCQPLAALVRIGVGNEKIDFNFLRVYCFYIKC